MASATENGSGYPNVTTERRHSPRANGSGPLDHLDGPGHDGRHWPADGEERAHRDLGLIANRLAGEDACGVPLEDALQLVRSNGHPGSARGSFVDMPSAHAHPELNGRGRPADPRKRFGCMVGRTHAIRRVYEAILRVAPTRAAILILGESGSGKELAAQTVHEHSPRRDRRFLAINCGAVAPSVIESELFGHERGSFTGAERSRKGYFEEADGGTLLLDEITEMRVDLQVRLLRVLEAGCVVRVGSSDPIPVDVRVIAATNCDPDAAVRGGRLRQDLFYRLNVFPLALPPLRDRRDDIELLAEHFLAEFNAREGTHKTWSDRALRRLEAYAWPGNVRELRNVVERAAILADDLIDDVIDDIALPAAPSRPRAVEGEVLQIPVGSPLAEAERMLILATLRASGGEKREAARRLGISVKTLYSRLGVYRAAGTSREPVEPGHGGTSNLGPESPPR